MRIARTSLTATLLFLAMTAPGQAADCRASAMRVTLGQMHSEPVRANADFTPCTTQSAHTVQKTAIGPVTAEALHAFTARSATGAGAASAVSVVELPPIRVEGLVSSAQSECVDGKVVTTSASRVVGLTLNGQPIDIPTGAQELDLGGLRLSFNETVTEGDTLTQRALVIDVPDAASVVLGEAIVGGDPCDVDVDEGETPDVPTAQVCPDGSTLDPKSGLCVIHTSSGGGNGNGNGNGNGGGNGTVIVVGPPYKGPSGGTVVPLDEARKRWKSPCLRGRGPKYVIVGTKRVDRVTGTDRSDRILLFAGRDRAEGGRKHDCIDAGRGKDAVSGDLGNDRMFGKRGKDMLIGEAGNDKLTSGRGRDNIRAGYGRDRIRGGRGVDALNVSTNGPAAKFIRCGKGRDRVRINRNERRRVFGCERVFRIR